MNQFCSTESDILKFFRRFTAVVIGYIHVLENVVVEVSKFECLKKQSTREQ